jgi:hypothetical protein
VPTGFLYIDTLFFAFSYAIVRYFKVDGAPMLNASCGGSPRLGRSSGAKSQVVAFVIVLPSIRMCAVAPSCFVAQTAIPDENVPWVELLIKSIWLLSRIVKPASWEFTIIKFVTLIYDLSSIWKTPLSNPSLANDQRAILSAFNIGISQDIL